MIYAVLEQNLPETTLMSNPKLYRKNRGNAQMSRSYLAQWTLLVLWHSLVSFFMWFFLYKGLHEENRDFQTLQTFVAQTIVFIVNFKVVLDSKNWTLTLLVSVMLLP